jgi:hypothetical protein
MHLAQVRAPTLGFTIYGLFAGVHLKAGGQPHRALIGRTFLQNLTMVYEGKTGTVTIHSTETLSNATLGHYRHYRLSRKLAARYNVIKIWEPY